MWIIAVPAFAQEHADSPIVDDLATLRQLSEQVQNTVRAAAGTADVQDDLSIKLGMDWPSRNGKGGRPTRLEELSIVRAFTVDGETVSLSSLVEPRLGNAPVSIIHKNAERAITVLAQNEGRAVTDIIDELTPQLDAMQADWPSGYSYKVGGEAQETAETFGSAGTARVVAIIMIFGLLVLMFGSFSQAFILIASLPLALIGTFLGFFIFGIDVSFFAMIGVITLMGIVANDAIVMIDTMNQHMAEGASVIESAARGAAERLRLIISTSVTTIVCLIPLAISNPMWRPLCLAVIFGLLASTLLSLIVVPCMYLLLTREGSKEQVSLD